MIRFTFEELLRISLLPTAYCLLPTAYCLLLLFSHWQLLQNLFLRLLDRHAVTLPVLIDRSFFQHVVPLIADHLNLPERILRWRWTARAFVTHLGLLLFRGRGGLVEFLRETGRPLQTRFGWQPILVAQSHRRRRVVAAACLKHP